MGLLLHARDKKHAVFHRQWQPAEKADCGVESFVFAFRQVRPVTNTVIDLDASAGTLEEQVHQLRDTVVSQLGAAHSCIEHLKAENQTLEMIKESIKVLHEI